MIISSTKDLSKSVVNVNVVELTMDSSVKWSGIETDNKLNFEQISNNYKKASNQLNTICRLQTFTGHKEKEEEWILACIQILTTDVLFGTSVLKISKIN